jgi:hypothetical protein
MAGTWPDFPAMAAQMGVEFWARMVPWKERLKETEQCEKLGPEARAFATVDS